MRRIGKRLGWTAAPVAATLALAACGGDVGREASVDDALRRDLQLAAAASVELANGGDANRARFVSAVEGNPHAEGAEVTRPDARATARHRAPTRGVRRVADVRPAPAAAEEPAPAVAVAEAPAAVSEAADAAPAPEPAETPAPSPEPERAQPAGGPSPDAGQGEGESDRRGRRGGGGGWIGVVIRGGGVGDGDNCEIHDRRGRGRGVGGIIVDRRYPGLPTGGWGGPIGGRVGGVLQRVGSRW